MNRASFHSESFVDTSPPLWQVASFLLPIIAGCTGCIDLGSEVAWQQAATQNDANEPTSVGYSACFTPDFSPSHVVAAVATE